MAVARWDLRDRARAVAVAALLASVPALGAAPPTEKPEDVGRRLYREGRGLAGPLAARVAGDVLVWGPQFSCQSCHGRSGMGAGEGGVVVPPIAALLFEASPQRRRPAYDEDTFARAVRDGVDASGRILDPLMPRYQLGGAEVAALVAYLRGLSAVPSPGVSENAVRFATVFTDDVRPETRRAVLSVLERYVDEKNRQTRLESRRPGHGSPPGETRPSTYREWTLDTWDLTGPHSGWERQMEARYAARPVFALLGGASGGSWEPMARFCERNEVPALLPTTDLPDASAGNFYTLYFSRGLLLEADLVAADLGAGPPRPVVQVYREEGAGRVAARSLEAALAARGTRVENRPLGPGETRPLGRLAQGLRGADVVLWLAPPDLAGLERLETSSGRLYLSSTLLERDVEHLPSKAPTATLVAHPFTLPGQRDPALARFKAWLGRSGAVLHDERRQAEAYFACLAAKEALMHAGRFFVRDYVLDRLDHAQGLVSYVPLYPRSGFGPGQRFLSKGGYLLPVEGGRLAVERARWINP